METVVSIERDLKPTTEREEMLAAVIEVYAFTLEFVLLLQKSGWHDASFCQSQITAARQAYKEATGNDVPYPGWFQHQLMQIESVIYGIENPGVASRHG